MTRLIGTSALSVVALLSAMAWATAAALAAPPPPDDRHGVGSVDGSVRRLAPDDPAFVYSPYNWTVPTASVAATINAGAYIRIMFSGPVCRIGFDVSNDRLPLSELYVRVDGYEAGSPWMRRTVADSIPCAPSRDTARQSFHLLELMVKSTSEQLPRWVNSATAIRFIGLTLASDAVAIAPAQFARRVLFYGDSITEAVRAVNQTAALDTDRNDALAGWAWATGKSLGAEFGIVGFGATGLTRGGSGQVPAIPTSYDQIMQDVPRRFTPCPDLIVINEGTNDRASTGHDVTVAMQRLLAGLSGHCGSSRIAILRPFNGAQAPALQAAVNAASPRVAYIDTTGFLEDAWGIDTNRLHPTSSNDLGILTPRLVNALLPLLEAGRDGAGGR